MKEIERNGAYAKIRLKRFHNTLEFMADLDLKSLNTLNLGPQNPLSAYLEKHGYTITNTQTGQDLDFDFEIVKTNSLAWCLALKS